MVAVCTKSTAASAVGIRPLKGTATDIDQLCRQTEFFYVVAFRSINPLVDNQLCQAIYNSTKRGERKHRNTSD